MICDETQKQNDIQRTQIAENMRFLADMRFKQLTILVTWLTVADGGIAQFGDRQLMKDNSAMAGMTIRHAIAVNALFFIAVFWIMEIRSTLAWEAHHKNVPDLWFRPSSTPIPFFTASNTIFAFYALQYVFWLWCAWGWAVPCWLTTLLLFLGIMIGFHGATNYWGGDRTENSEKQRDISVDRSNAGAK